MCGIIGIINSDDRFGERELALLNDTMQRRGPDGSGLFWDGRTGFAMRRLAIIDLAGGQQPIFSEDRKVAVVMNGEIYNYRSLREQLIAAGHRFATHSDTETLVHGYEQFGIDGLLERLDGMFAFALWDRARNRMFLARDRFGEKPLYIAGERNTVVFGSQLLSVVAALSDRPPISAPALQLYWALHFVPGDQTIFQGVHRLRPGEACEINTGSGQQVRRWRYWRLRERPRKIEAEELGELIRQAVTSRLVADVPVGVFLSGGLDSSLLASLAAQQTPGIHTFSTGFDSARHDESGYAWEVANCIGSTHHHFMFRVDEFRALIPDVIEHMDEPVGDQAMLPLFALARAAVKEVKVVLSGEGADELFAGYSYYGGRSADTNRVFFDDREQTASGFPAVLPKSVRQRLSPDTGAWAGGWHEELLADMLAVRDPLRRESFCDIATWLSEDLLMKADKMTMANSLEGRAPYLSPAVAEAAFNLPAQDKIAGGTVKVLLRAAAKNHLPRSILTRCKQGWVLPMEKWLRVNLHDEFIDAIRACDEPLLDRASMETLVREDRSGRGASIGGRALYALMVMVRWLNHADQKLAEHRRQLRAESPPDVLPEPVSPRWA